MTSPFGPMVLIFNPRAGRGAAATTLPDLIDALNERGLEYEVRQTQRAGHATEIARTALAEGIRFVVAVGGDGTIHEVVNGMITDDEETVPDSVLGVVAGGSGSDFIKTFGMPASPTHAAAHLDGPESFRIDIGKATYQDAGRTVIRYFPNIAEVGLGAATVAMAQRLPRFFGPTIYFFAFWLALGRHRPAQVEIDLVDRKYDGPMSNLVIANGQFFGGGMKIAPKAVPTDGLLDIQIHHARKREAIALLPKLYKGQHLPHSDIEESKRVWVSVVCDRPLPIEADGEMLGTTPATFEVLRDVISLKV